MKKIFNKTFLSFLLVFSFLMPTFVMAEETNKDKNPIGVSEEKDKEKNKTETETTEPKKDDKKDNKEVGKYPVIRVKKIILNEKDITDKAEIEKIIKELDLTYSLKDVVTAKVDSSEFELYKIDTNNKKVDFVIKNKYYDYTGVSINGDPGQGTVDGKEFSLNIKQKENDVILRIHRNTLNLTVKAKGPKIQLEKLKAKLNGKDLELNKKIAIFVGTENKLDFTGFDDNFKLYKDNKPVKLPLEFTMADNYEWEFELKPSRMVNRLSGSDRFLTALDTAKETYEKPETVIVANGREGSADALAAGPLAKALNAPILLVEKDSIKKEVLEYIHNDKIKKIVVVGGTGSVSSKVFNSLKVDNADVKIERIRGINRYETSQKIVKELIKNHKYNKEVVLVDGRQNADALSATPYSVLKKAPILLVSPSMDTTKAKDFLKDLGVKKSVVIGGKSSVNTLTINKLELNNTLRIEGKNRFDTSQEVCKKLQGEKDYINALILANGTDKYSIDALTASSLLNKVNAPILLVEGKTYTDSLKKFVDDLKVSPFNAYLVGGESAISSEIINNIGY